MRNLLLVSVVCVFCTLSAMAQDTPQVEVFGGYSLLHDGNASPTNFQGWDASSTAYVNRWFGITADFSGHYSTTNVTALVAPGISEQDRFTQHIHTFMFGPHLAYRKSRYVPFGQALFGVNHTAAGLSVSCPLCGSPIGGVPPPAFNTFSMALGGGVDIAVGHGFSVRPVQAEYILRRVDSFNDNQFRYAAGIVFRLGSIRSR